MKRMSSLLLIVCFVAGMITSLSCAADAASIDSGTCGAGLTWEIEDTTLVISGSGDMTNWSEYSHVPWRSISSSVKNVIIDEGVTSIGNYAFYGFSELSSISIPNSVTCIGDYAFYECISLTGISIPNGVTSIGDDAFAWCLNLESINIPNSVTSLGNGVFYWCIALSDILLSDSVTLIGNSAFYRCISLTDVSIPSGVTSINADTFCRCIELKSISMPEGITSVSDRAFYECISLEIINIPNSVAWIGENTFYGCSSLISINIPDSLTRIEDGAFERCEALAQIDIPNTVTSIGEWAFYRCNSLSDVYYGGSAEEWGKIGIEIVNTDLVNATIHYSSVMPDVSEPPPVSVVYKKIGEKVEFTVIANDSARLTDFSKVTLFLAEYGRRNVLTRVKKGVNGNISNNMMTVTVDLPLSDNYKFMLWGINQKPIIVAITDID
ncbi:MAG: leucine-rich repeat domain-containing protein [Clostridia bacterium]|nr:leucine-rich repeat domain-containing protein [Clostridia bacterium]